MAKGTLQTNNAVKTCTIKTFIFNLQYTLQKHVEDNPIHYIEHIDILLNSEISAEEVQRDLLTLNT